MGNTTISLDTFKNTTNLLIGLAVHFGRNEFHLHHFLVAESTSDHDGPTFKISPGHHVRIFPDFRRLLAIH